MKFAVTGWAWRTPLGNHIDRAVDRLRAGEQSALPSPFASYGPAQVAPIRDAPKPTRNARLVSSIALHAIEAAEEALTLSGAQAGASMGLFAGMGGLRAGFAALMPAMQAQVVGAEASWQRGLRAMHPLWMLRYLSNNAHGLVSAQHDIRGEGSTHSGPRAGAQAYLAATRALRLGSIERALVIAYDTLLCPELLQAHQAALVPGEAAAALVIEAAGKIESPLALLGPTIDSEPSAAIANATGDLGAAMPLVQAIALARENSHAR